MIRFVLEKNSSAAQTRRRRGWGWGGRLGAAAEAQVGNGVLRRRRGGLADAPRPAPNGPRLPAGHLLILTAQGVGGP